MRLDYLIQKNISISLEKKFILILLEQKNKILLCNFDQDENTRLVTLNDTFNTFKYNVLKLKNPDISKLDQYFTDYYNDNLNPDT